LVNLSAIAFAVRRTLSNEGTPLPFGHVQQLVAAALGHNNLASYQASGDDVALEHAANIVVDLALLATRRDELGAEELNPLLVVHGLRERYPDAQVHNSLDDYVSAIQSELNYSLPNDARVSSEVAMTNGWMPVGEFELPFWKGFDEFGGDEDDVSLELEGSVVVEQDPERVYYGHEVDVMLQMFIERHGRRGFGPMTYDVSRCRAALDG
jgi:hypothetical protein